MAIALFIAVGFFSGATTRSQQSFTTSTCQMAAVQPPLKTSDSNRGDVVFKKGWEEKQAREAISFIKK